MITIVFSKYTNFIQLIYIVIFYYYQKNDKEISCYRLESVK